MRPQSDSLKLGKGAAFVKTHSYGESRDRVRHELAREANPD